MSQRARWTLAGAVALSSFTIWAVHFQQEQERETMYQGVLRDDERRRAKYMKRKEELEASMRKRELYERLQTVSGANEEENRSSIQR